MPRGGARVGAGRPAGVKDGQGKVSFSFEKVAKQIELSPEKTPLAHMLAVMQNVSLDDKMRLQAAIAAAPYVHPKLSQVEVKGNETAPLRVESDIGRALASLAEMVRNKQAIEGEIVEGATGRGDDAVAISQSGQADPSRSLSLAVQDTITADIKAVEDSVGTVIEAVAIVAAEENDEAAAS